MKSRNCNNSKPCFNFFTLFAFLLGIILYIILRQEKEDKPDSELESLEIVPEKKRIPESVNKIKPISKTINTIKLSDRQQTIIRELMDKGKMYPSELQDLIPSVSSRTIRRDMGDLERKGLVQQKGTTKSTYYVYIGS